MKWDIQNMKKKIIMLAATLLFAIGLLSGCDKTPALLLPPTAEIVILHTNDTHGRIIGNDTDIIGIDRISAIHKNTPNSILVDAGDSLHGLPTATLSKGADIAALMREAGYSAMAVGNHEFNYGWERLSELRDIAGFPLLSSNITKNGNSFLDDTIIIELNSVKIGLFGLTTELTAYSAMPGYVSGLIFEDPVKAAREKTEFLREQGVHVVVALCHLGSVPVNGTLATELTRDVPEIDVIIDGHSHTALSEGLLENGVLIAQTGQNGNNLGKLTISVENGVVMSRTASLIGYEDMITRCQVPIDREVMGSEMLEQIGELNGKV